MDVMINYGAVILSVVVAIVLGTLWYGPLFGKAWMRIVHLEKPEHMTKSVKKMMAKSYAIMAVGTLVMAYVLAHVLYYTSSVTRITGVDAGIQAGVWSWVGFVAPVMMGSVIWEGRPWKYWFITAGYYLVALVIMGAIMGAMQ